MSEHTHDHGNDHDHTHPNQPDIDSEPMGYYQLMGSALSELLVEKGVITADELRSAIENVDSRSPEGGARVVARLGLILATKRVYWRMELQQSTNLALTCLLPISLLLRIPIRYTT